MLTRRITAGVLRRVSDLAYRAHGGRSTWRLGVHGTRQLDALRDLEHRFGLHVRTVLYVGANRGQEVDLLCLAFPEAVVHCFEPQSECQDDLRVVAARWPGRVEVHAVALSDSVGEATLRRPSSHDQAASLLEPGSEMAVQFPHVNGWAGEVVRTDTLDRWAAGRTLSDDVLLKMDVQGAEPLVLDGGSETLRRVRLVISELAVVPTYDAAPDMHTMFDRLGGLGFRYGGELEQVRGQDVTVVEFDGAFVRSQVSGVV
ncbi:FkbM family methyltransferase [Motilibacter peucedani]|uniref:FkbM family methyltransferase n=1 Tax=Motilibacter peucedani TaxID=598650 RepID=A0A420XU82_9ACTN|nr:FkbM family methyltransferase [Motilibacter peucedani]RKS80310.1 FkbM family methyltransferase [Motilibacter peucedani]